MDDLRTAYRKETFTELCSTCRSPTGLHCFECKKPICEEHAHLRCKTCGEAAAAACPRCGDGTCSNHTPGRSNRRCPQCEKWLWTWAGQMSSVQAPARMADYGAIIGFFAGSIIAAPMAPAAAVTLAAAAVLWPGGKIGYIAARRAAKVRQLRPEFLRETSPSRASCLAHPYD